MLPNFLLIGTAKSGSTSLYYYLKQHPQIYMSPVKEPGFFLVRDQPAQIEVHENANVKAYSFYDQGAYEALFQARAGEKAVGEASVAYLCYPVAEENLLELNPKAKMIVMLRNPSQRAFSHFLYNRARGFESNHSFEDVVKNEMPLLDQELEWGTTRPTYIRTGFYARHLKRFFKSFDRSQFEIHWYEELAAQPNLLLQEIFSFLEVDPAYQVDTSVRHKKSGLPRSRLWNRFLTRANPIGKALRPFLPRDRRRAIAARLNAPNLRRPTMAPDVHAKLIETFRPDILALQDLLQKDLSAWLVL